MTPISKTQADPIKTPEYRKLCTQLLRNPRPFDQIRYRDGITLKMAKSIYYGANVFVVLEIQNNSLIDYEIDSMDLYKVNGNKKRKASYQELPLGPIYWFNIPKLVRKGETVQFVLGYPKFTLGRREKLMVKLKELNGGRDVVSEYRK